jgi:hypothetical protein
MSLNVIRTIYTQEKNTTIKTPNAIKAKNQEGKTKGASKTSG